MSLASHLTDHEVAIFLFHGVVEESHYCVRNYMRKHLTREVFVRALEQLAACGHPISLAGVVDHCASGEPFPPRSFAISFDDGFENNFSVAAPILNDFEVPATFFVTSSFIEHNLMSWVDRIEHCLEHVRCGELRLPWADRPQAFSGPESKITLLEQIRCAAKSDPSVDLDELVSDVFAQCQVPQIAASDDPLDRKMSWRQVAELARHDLFTVGGHGHTHRIMTFLDDDALESEVSTCLDSLGRSAGVTARHYSYPEGLAHCYCDRVIEVLKRHGIVCCPTAREGTNALDANLFELKRIPVVSVPQSLSPSVP